MDNEYQNDMTQPEQLQSAYELRDQLQHAPNEYHEIQVEDKTTGEVKNYIGQDGKPVEISKKIESKGKDMPEGFEKQFKYNAVQGKEEFMSAEDKRRYEHFVELEEKVFEGQTLAEQKETAELLQETAGKLKGVYEASKDEDVSPEVLKERLHANLDSVVEQFKQENPDVDFPAEDMLRNMIENDPSGVDLDLFTDSLEMHQEQIELGLVMEQEQQKEAPEQHQESLEEILKDTDTYRNFKNLAEHTRLHQDALFDPESGRVTDDPELLGDGIHMTANEADNMVLNSAIEGEDRMALPEGSAHLAVASTGWRTDHTYALEQALKEHYPDLADNIDDMEAALEQEDMGMEQDMSDMEAANDPEYDRERERDGMAMA